MTLTLAKKARRSNKNPKYCYICGTRIFESIRCICFKGNYKFNKKEEISSCVGHINNKNRFKKAEAFIRTKEWKDLKKQIIRIYGCKCMKCGLIGLVHVDHIMPKSRYPRKKLDPTNLQILCKSCNCEKGVKHETDYRTDKHKRLLDIARSNNRLIRHHWPRPLAVQERIDRKIEEKNKKEIARQIRINAKPKIILRKKQLISLQPYCKTQEYL